MAKLIKTPEGAFFQETPSGLAVINDPRTLQQLLKNEIPYENQAFSGSISSQVASPNLIPQPKNEIPNPGETYQNPDPLAAGTNPIEKFNLALVDMMKKAQEGQRLEQDQKDVNARDSFAAGSQPMVGEYANLSAEDKMAAMNRRKESYNPSIDAATTRINQYQTILDMMKKTYGEDMSAMLPATEEDALIFKQAMQAGWKPDKDTLKKYAKWITPEDLQAAFKDTTKDPNKTLGYKNANTLLMNNPDASYEELYDGILTNTDLGAGEAQAFLVARGYSPSTTKSETYVPPSEIKAIAQNLVDSYGKDGAIESIRTTGTVNLDSTDDAGKKTTKSYKLNTNQQNEIIAEINNTTPTPPKEDSWLHKAFDTVSPWN